MALTLSAQAKTTTRAWLGETNEFNVEVQGREQKDRTVGGPLRFASLRSIRAARKDGFSQSRKCFCGSTAHCWIRGMELPTPSGVLVCHVGFGGRPSCLDHLGALGR